MLLMQALLNSDHRVHVIIISSIMTNKWFYSFDGFNEISQSQ